MATLTDRPERTPRRPQAPRPQQVRASEHRTPRLVAYATAAVAIAAAVAAIVLALSSGTPPPATGAASLVPDDALLYLNVSTDPSRPPVQQAMARLRRLPGAPLLFAAVTARLDSILSGSSAGTVDFGSDVRPWLGPEVAFAVLDTPGASAGTLTVLSVRRPARARAFLSAHGAVPDGSYGKTQLLREPSGTTLAFLGHYLVVGQAASVAAAIDVAGHRAPSLASSHGYQVAAAGEPADRVLDFYAPVDGVLRALAPSQGFLGALGTLLYQPALTGVSVSVSPDPGGFSVVVHSALDRKLARTASVQARSFTPSLAPALPAGSAMVLDVGNLRGAVPKLLAAAAKLGIAGRASSLLGRLGGALATEGMNMHRFFSSFGSESALAIVPGYHGSAPAPVLVGRPAHPSAALAELGELEGPLTQAFTPPSGSGGLVPEVGATTVGAATVSTLTLAPGLQLDWGVSHGLVAVSTSPRVVASVLSRGATLGGEQAYKNAVGGLPSQVTSLVFLDVGPLLRLGTRTGLIGGTTLRALLADLEQIRAVGLTTTRGESDTTTQLQLQMP